MSVELAVLTIADTGPRRFFRRAISPSFCSDIACGAEFTGEAEALICCSLISSASSAFIKLTILLASVSGLAKNLSGFGNSFPVTSRSATANRGLDASADRPYT